MNFTTSSSGPVAGTSSGNRQSKYPTLLLEPGHDDFNEPSASNKTYCPCCLSNDDEDDSLEEQLYDLYSGYYRLELNATLALAKAQVDAHLQEELAGDADQVSVVQ